MVLDYHLGLRQPPDFQTFINNTFNYYPNITLAHTDDFNCYAYINNFITNRTTEKDFTTHIESLNAILRHRLAVFKRRAITISKKISRFAKTIELFFYFYNKKLYDALN